MTAHSNGHSSRTTTSRAEVRLKAKAVSRGIAIGRVVCLFGNDRQYYRVDIPEKDIASEVRRFRAAVRLSTRQLKKLIGKDGSKQSAGGQEFFETH